MRTTPRPRTARSLSAPLATLLVLLAGCSPDNTGPVDPPPPPPQVQSVTILPSNPTLSVGDRLTLTAEFRDQNGATMSGLVPTWTSGSTSIATVTSNGSSATVTALSAGSVSILASVNGVTGSAVLSVAGSASPTPVATVRCTPPIVTLAVGASASLQATAHDATGSVLPGRPTTWSASPAGVVTIGNGTVTALAPGSATVTATIDGRSGSCVITVPTQQQQFTLAITNQLIATVQVSVQGQSIGTLPAQSTRQATIASAPGVEVTFEVVEPRLGNRVLGDRMSGRWSLVAPTGTVTLTIDNRIGDQWYFAPVVTNLSGTSLLMAVNFGLQSENRCQCTVPVGGQRVFLGYYRLWSNSMVHAFANGSDYTGPYRYFYSFANQIPRGSGVLDFTFPIFP